MRGRPRIVGAGERELLADLDAACYPRGKRMSKADIAEALNRKRWAVVVASDVLDPGTPVGYLVGRYQPDGGAFDLHRLGVTPSHRKRGIARSLLATLKDVEIRGLVPDVDLPSQLAARALGFTAVGIWRHGTDPHGDVIEFRKPPADDPHDAP